MGDGAFPQALAHGELGEILPSIYLVTGAFGMARPPLCFSRNMTVVREPAGLVLVNSVRLSDQGLTRLDALGKVTDVIRLPFPFSLDLDIRFLDQLRDRRDLLVDVTGEFGSGNTRGFEALRFQSVFDFF